MNRFKFLTHTCIFSNLNTMNLKLFRYRGAKYRFKKIQKIFWREYKPLRSPLKYERVYPCSYFWRAGVVIDSIFVYHFVDPDLKVEIFPCKCLKKISCKFQKNVGFLGVFWWLKMAFRSSLDLYFYPSIVNFRMGEKILRLLLMCLEALEEGFSCEILGRRLVGTYCLK